MKTIIYKVPLIKQGVSECVQASVTQLLNYHKINKSINQVKEEVPVHVNSGGEPAGTSVGHMASYVLSLGFEVVMYTTDVVIFDRSWKNLDSGELVKILKEREPFISHPRYSKEDINLIFEGYISFLENGGKISFQIIDDVLLHDLLTVGPFLAVTSYQFLNDIPKYAYIGDDKYKEDSINGWPSTHMIIVVGYKDGKYLILDSDKDNSGKKWIDSSRLIGSIYLAETDYDSMVISISPKQ